MTFFVPCVECSQCHAEFLPANGQRTCRHCGSRDTDWVLKLQKRVSTARLLTPRTWFTSKWVDVRRIPWKAS